MIQPPPSIKPPVFDENIRRYIRYAGELIVAISSFYASCVREPEKAARAGYEATAPAIAQLSKQAQESFREREELRAYLLEREAQEAAAWDREVAAPIVPTSPGVPQAIVVAPVGPRPRTKVHAHVNPSLGVLPADPFALPPLPPPPPTAPVASSEPPASRVLVVPPSSASVAVVIVPPPPSVPPAPPAPPSSVSVPSFDKALDGQK